MSEVLIVGGAGRIGLTMAAVLSEKHTVGIYDINGEASDLLRNESKATFYEPELSELLLKNDSKINTEDSLDVMYRYDNIIIAIGTPIDEYLNPDFKIIFELFRKIKKNLDGLEKIRKKDMKIILCSTVYPGTTKKLQKLIDIPIFFCPERVSTGSMVGEFRNLPQIISYNKENDPSKLVRSAMGLFTNCGIKVSLLNDTTEGELLKLFTNSYRYINFSIANKFYMLSEKFGCDFYNIYDKMKEGYPRLKDFPRPGLTGGYCLRKDTLQLAAHDGFSLGMEASIINEKIPLHIFRKVRELTDHILYDKTVGILGMAFKGNTDDKRDSLAYRLRKIFLNECEEVLCTDEYIKDKTFNSLQDVLSKSDIIIVAAYHDGYKYINFEVLKEDDKIIIDLERRFI